MPWITYELPQDEKGRQALRDGLRRRFFWNCYPRFGLRTGERSMWRLVYSRMPYDEDMTDEST